MSRKPRHRPIPRIPSYWFRLAPGQRLRFWVRVHRIAQTRSVKRSNLKSIQAIINEELGL